LNTSQRNDVGGDQDVLDNEENVVVREIFQDVEVTLSEIDVIVVQEIIPNQQRYDKFYKTKSIQHHQNCQ